ncbi:MAG: hypothetical protein PSV16_13535 [Flavobacterium sp.]|nr:hypothetical protein [Flavobacterium sp.]
MADTIIVFDEADTKLGSFFQLCIDDLNVFFDSISIQPTYLNSAKLNDLSVQLVTEPLNTFVFGAYSHGGKNCLVKSNASYISTTVNNTSFQNSFFYTFSCSCGHELGSNLFDNGCLCFIGYNKIISIWSTYVQPFVVCANYGLKLFFNGVNTLQIETEMKEQYNTEIDAIYPADFIIASILRENRDALVRHGNDINITHL